MCGIFVLELVALAALGYSVYWDLILEPHFCLLSGLVLLGATISMCGHVYEIGLRRKADPRGLDDMSYDTVVTHISGLVFFFNILILFL